MGEPETLTAPARPAIHWQSRWNIAELLALYDAGKSMLRAKAHDRWRETFALAVSQGSVYCGFVDAVPGLMAVYWQTDQPVVDIKHRIPIPKVGGPYVYICWLWNAYGPRGLVRLLRHIEATCHGAGHIAHHDQRRKSEQKRSDIERLRGNNRLIVHPLRAIVDKGAEAVLARLNGVT